MIGNPLVQEILEGITKNIKKNLEPKIEQKLCSIHKNIFILISEELKEFSFLKGFEKYEESVSLILPHPQKEALKEKNWTYPVYTEKDKGMIKNMDILFVPYFSQNTAAKLRAGIQDTMESRIIWKSLWHGKRVIGNIITLRTCDDSDTKNITLKEIVRQNVNFIEKMGVIWTQEENYLRDIEKIQRAEEAKIEQVGRMIITEKDILRLEGKKNKLYLTKDSIITPLAKDCAKEKNITLIRG